jgi:CheY-like chemotaxis protein
MKILVIDDDALILRSLALHLGDAGYLVTTATDGSEAIDRIENESEKPDLIICDLLMPNISGLTFISLLRNFHNCSIPVITISSLPKGDLLSMYAGIEDIDFLPKPFRISQILEKVKDYNTKKILL